MTTNADDNHDDDGGADRSCCCPSCCTTWATDPFSQVLFACQLQSFASAGYIQFGLIGAVFTQVKDEFNLTYTQLTVGLVVYQLGVILVSVLSPVFQGKYFGHPTLESLCGIGCIITLLGAIIYASAQWYWMLMVGQMFLGAGNAFVFIFYTSMFSALCPEGEVTKISDGIGKTSMMAPLGMVLAFLLVGIFGAEHWRWYYALAAVLMVPSIWWFFRLSIGYKTVHDPRLIRTENDPKFKELISEVCSNPRLICAVFAISMATFVVAAYAPFLPGYVEEHIGQSKENAAFFMAAAIPFITLSMGAGGYIAHAKKWAPPKISTLGAFSAFGAAVMVAITFGANITIFYLFAVLCIITLCIIFFISAPALAIIAMLLPHDMIAHGQALLGLVSRTVGALCAPILVAVLLDEGLSYNIVFLIAGGIGTLSAMIFFTLVAVLTRNAVPVERISGGEPLGAAEGGTAALALVTEEEERGTAAGGGAAISRVESNKKFEEGGGEMVVVVETDSNEPFSNPNSENSLLLKGIAMSPVIVPSSSSHEDDETSEGGRVVVPSPSGTDTATTCSLTADEEDR